MMDKLRASWGVGLLVFGLSAFQTSCVTTRAELRGEGSERSREAADRRPITVQQLRAQEALRDQEHQEQLRELHGRIETLEHQLQVALREKAEDQERQLSQLMDSRLKLYEEALANSEKQLQQLTQELSELKKKEVASPAPRPTGPNAAFLRAEKLFSENRWREAIVEYQAYRESQPQGEHYPEATYKMGVCFQELNMLDEARAFYQEAVDRFPGSGAARRSNTRLRGLN